MATVTTSASASPTTGRKKENSRPNILSRRLSTRLVKKAYSDPAIPNQKAKTRIICTIGPKTNNVETLSKMIQAGMNVARMNFSHGDHAYHASVIKNVREASKQTGTHVAIMLDTKGPEIRTGKLKGGKDVHLTAGHKFTFVNDQSVLGDETIVNTTYSDLPNSVSPGDKILVDDGLIGFTVDKCDADAVHCTIDNSGYLGETKGVNLPGSKVTLPAVTEKDKRDIRFGVENDVDMIAASFIREASNVEEIRNLPGVREKGIHVMSKIESQEGLDNFDAILEVSNSIMVARGDLGVEIPLEKIAAAQKMMIEKCNMMGKPVVTATQMLESMVDNPRPTRAEALDVANAVYDGTDCVMLSGETAKGKYPIECIRAMYDICCQAEGDIDYRLLYRALRSTVTPPVSISDSVASSAVKSTWDLNAKLLIALTESGNAARLISKYRPHTPILCVSHSEKTLRQLLVSRGAYPFLVRNMGDDSKILEALQYAKETGLCNEGDNVVITSGRIQGVSGATNTVRVMRVP